jgi:hypothetical protein
MTGGLTMKLFENEYIRLSIDESVPCLELIGKMFMPSDVFRESQEKSLQFYLDYRDKYPNMLLFVDTRDIGQVAPKDTEWIAEEILAKFAAAGLKKEVFVVPPSTLEQMVMTNYISSAGETIEMKVFDNVATAKKWLKTRNVMEIGLMSSSYVGVQVCRLRINIGTGRSPGLG